MLAPEVRELMDGGMFGYGSEIAVHDFAALEDIQEPNISTMNGIDAVNASRAFELKLVGLYDNVNQQLLGVGRKLTRRGDVYVVPTIGDTLKYVEQYNNQASSKRAKASKLYRSFTALHPNEVTEDDHVTDRLNTARENQANRFA